MGNEAVNIIRPSFSVHIMKSEPLKSHCTVLFHSFLYQNMSSSDKTLHQWPLLWICVVSAASPLQGKYHHQIDPQPVGKRLKSQNKQWKLTWKLQWYAELFITNKSIEKKRKTKSKAKLIPILETSFGEQFVIEMSPWFMALWGRVDSSFPRSASPKV